MNGMVTVKALVMLMFFLPAWAGAAVLGELRLSMITGDVQIKNNDTGQWVPAVINLPLREGDQLWVPSQGRAEVESRRGSIVRLDERSLLEVLRVDPDALQFYLSMGLCYVNAKGERGTTLQLDTPHSSLRVYERSKFSAEVWQPGTTEVAVFLGAIMVESNKGVTSVDGGNMLSVGENSADLSPLGLADDWERWNKDQDRIVEERRESVRYLPEELAGYSRDFDDNGEWVEVPDYGTVWRPIVHVSRGWSPYRHGRWLWIGDDYIWVAQEPWGWAPYHYGRWSYVERHGWCWVPPERHQVFWGPGYVGWVTTATSVSWVPLAPREIYYGHGHYGKYSEDISHGRVHKVRGAKVYRNVAVGHGVTTIHRETFLRGKHVDLSVRDNPFLDRDEVSVGRPEIKPVQDTKVAVIREVPPVSAPPEAAREIDRDRRKGRRRLVKSEDRSVFAPDKTPAAMPIVVRGEPKRRESRQGRSSGTSAQGLPLTPREGGDSPVVKSEEQVSGEPGSTPALGHGGPRTPRMPSLTGARPATEEQRSFGGRRRYVEPDPRTEGELSSPPEGGAIEPPPSAEKKYEGRWPRHGSEAPPSTQGQGGVREPGRDPVAPDSTAAERPSLPEANEVVPMRTPPAENTGARRWQRPAVEALPASPEQMGHGEDPLSSVTVGRTRAGQGVRSGRGEHLPDLRMREMDNEQRVIQPPSANSESVPSRRERGDGRLEAPLPAARGRILLPEAPAEEKATPVQPEGVESGRDGRGRMLFRGQQPPGLPDPEPSLGGGLRGINRQEIAPAIGRMPRGAASRPVPASQPVEGGEPTPSAADRERTEDNDSLEPTKAGE